MDNIFRQKHTVTAMHTDCFSRVKTSALLYFAQEAAGAHCAQLSLDHKALAKENLFWAVVRNRVQITRLPALGETITVETWPMPTTRSSFPRSTVAYDEAGKELFRCVSLWVLVDINTRAMVLPGRSNISLTGTLRGGELALPESIAPKTLENTTLRRVGYTELDRNMHMNNTRYLDWIDDLFPSEFHQLHPVRDFTICYLYEARQGEEISLRWQVLDGPCVQIDGYRAAENPQMRPMRIFSAQLDF